MPTVKEDFLKGGTRALLSAERMHAAAGFPAAAPLTPTLLTRPLEPKVTVAREGEAIPATQPRAAPRTAAMALWACP